MANDLFDSGPGDEGVAVDGLVGTGQGAPHIATPGLAVVVEAGYDASQRLIGEELAEDQVAVLAEEVVVLSVHAFV